MMNIMISVKSGNHSMNRINDDHLMIFKDVNRSTDRFQDPISVQKTVHPPKTKSGLLRKSFLKSEIGRKLNGEKIICFKAFVSFNNFNET